MSTRSSSSTSKSSSTCFDSQNDSSSSTTGKGQQQQQQHRQQQTSPPQPPDVILLRRALRLVHCLQKERGASGAYCASLAANAAGAAASSGTTNAKPTFDQRATTTTTTLKQQQHVGTWDAVQAARQSSDSAIQLFVASSTSSSTNHLQQPSSFRPLHVLQIPVAATLQKVRALLPNDDDSNNTAATAPTTPSTLSTTFSSPSPTLSTLSKNPVICFHRILVCFNALIATIIHECILRHTAVARKYYYYNNNTTLSSFRHLRQYHPANARCRSAGNPSPALTGSSSFSCFSMLQQQSSVTRASSIGPLQQQPQHQQQQSQYRPVGVVASHLIPPRVTSAQQQSVFPSSSSSSSLLQTGRTNNDTIGTLSQQQQPQPPSSQLSSHHHHHPYHPRQDVYPSSDPSRMEYFSHVVPSPPETLIPTATRSHETSLSDESTSLAQLHHSESELLPSLSETPVDTTITNTSPSTATSSITVPSWLELLQLLDCFTRLKESTGMERAVLCSILAAGQVDAVWLNDLIVQVENQRKLVQELQELMMCGSGGGKGLQSPTLLIPSISNNELVTHNNSSNLSHLQSLQHLVLDVIQMNPNLQALQNKILTDCTMEGLANHYPQQQQQPNGLIVWDLLSTYIDKLHALELLILEEMEYSLPIVLPTATASTTATTTTTQDLSTTTTLAGSLPNNAQSSSPTIAAQLLHDPAPTEAHVVAQQTTSTNKDALKQILLDCRNDVDSALSDTAVQHVQGMSADHVKEMLLELLSNQKDKHESTPKQQQQQQQHRSDDQGNDVLGNQQEKNHHHHHHDKQGHNPKSLDHHDSILDPLDEWTTMTTNSSKEWEINLYEITFQKRIGRGASGTTYQAKWSGQRVAVKVAAITEMGLEGWRTEVQALQKLHHPNIIRLLGSVCNPSPLTYCLVLEYCSAGDLSLALQQSTPRAFFWIVASGMAHGMAYLHSRNIIHRDIKPSNVLLDGDLASGVFVVKVSDFGVSTTLRGDEDRTAETGTYRWMAPEVIRHEAYSHMADVYSFAVVLWQLLSRESPFGNVSQIAAAGKVALEGARPPFPLGTPTVLRELIETCWQEVPQERLPFDRISQLFLASELQAGMTPEETAWLESSHGHSVYARMNSNHPILPTPSPAKLISSSLPPASLSLPSQPLLPTTTASSQPSSTGSGNGKHHSDRVNKSDVLHHHDQHQQQQPHHYHHSQHQQQGSQVRSPQQQSSEKKGSFRRIFPKLARS